MYALLFLSYVNIFGFGYNDCIDHQFSPNGVRVAVGRHRGLGYYHIKVSSRYGGVRVSFVHVCLFSSPSFFVDGQIILHRIVIMLYIVVMSIFVALGLASRAIHYQRCPLHARDDIRDHRIYRGSISQKQPGQQTCLVHSSNVLSTLCSPIIRIEDTVLLMRHCSLSRLSHS